MIKAALLVAASLVSVTAVADTHYKVVPESSAQFGARITGGTFTGSTKAVSGSLEIADDGKVTKGTVLVNADKLETGMSTRDSHMKEKYLETDKYPIIALDLAGATLPQTGVGAADVAGTFEMHGVKKPVTVHVVIADIGGGGRRATSTFTIDVTDYGIAQPKFAVVKMDTKVDVSVDVRFAASGQ